MSETAPEQFASGIIFAGAMGQQRWTERKDLRIFCQAVRTVSYRDAEYFWDF